MRGGWGKKANLELNEIWQAKYALAAVPPLFVVLTWAARQAITLSFVRHVYQLENKSYVGKLLQK